jgi:FKBP-type peptidyl-prolyl cis-trans isomerase
VEKYRLPKHLLEKEEAIRTDPAHAYEGKELASDYRLDRGQDLFAHPAEEVSKQEQKEAKRKRQEQKETRRREKEKQREEKEERKRKRRAKEHFETSDSDLRKKHRRKRSRSPFHSPAK